MGLTALVKSKPNQNGTLTVEWASFSVRIPCRMWSFKQVPRLFGQWVLHQMQGKFCFEIVVQRPYWLQRLWWNVWNMRGAEKPSSSLQIFGRWWLDFFNSSFVFGFLNSLLSVVYLESFCWLSVVYWSSDIYRRHCCVFILNTVVIILSFLFY